MDPRKYNFEKKTTPKRIYIPKICVNATEKSTTNKFQKESASLRKSRQITKNNPAEQSKSRSSSQPNENSENEVKISNINSANRSSSRRRIIPASNADDSLDGNQIQNSTTIIAPKDWLLANAKSDSSKIIKMLKDDPKVC